MFVQLITVIIIINATLAHAEPQLGNIFKPAIDLFSTLTGESEEPTRYRPEDNFQSAPTYYYHEYRPQRSSYQQSSYQEPTYQQPRYQQNNQQPSYQRLQPERSRYQEVSSGSCSDYWSYQFDTENYGLLTIPNPNYSKNVLRIVLSLATQLQTVSLFLSCLHNLSTHEIKREVIHSI